MQSDEQKEMKCNSKKHLSEKIYSILLHVVALLNYIPKRTVVHILHLQALARFWIGDPPSPPPGPLSPYTSVLVYIEAPAVVCFYWVN